MPVNLQFAFLGCGHNYFARVMRISDNGLPQDDECFTVSYGLPKEFTSKFDKKSYDKVFLFNVRGHDFLSHCGQWKNSKGKGGYLDTSSTSISELPLLEPLKDENIKNGYDGPEIIISFGPQSSSFFADVTAPNLKRYKSWNLPIGLDDEIQKNRDAKGYGNIYEVMMNADGGWVILFGRGESFAFGGALPRPLEQVLADAKGAKKGTIFRPKLNNSIYRIYLNHQNRDEYLLLFSDGRCYASLHEDFREPLKIVVSRWAKGNALPNFEFTFIPSCQCSEYTQRLQNASYYSKRGLYHLSKRNVDLALKYLREAADEDERSLHIRERFAMAIVAMRHKRGSDQVLNERIKYRAVQAEANRPRRLENQDEDILFRNEYMWILNENYVIAELETMLDELQKSQTTATGIGVFNEWSYDKAMAGDEVHEAGSPLHRYIIPKDGAFEMEAEVVRAISHELSAEHNIGTGEDKSKEYEVNTTPNCLQKTSRIPFRFGNRFKKN